MSQNKTQKFVSIEKLGNLALIWLDNPPVNVLSHQLRTGLFLAIQDVEKDDDLEAAIILCRGRTFIAGADIKEFNRPTQSPLVTEIADAMEASSKLWIAALHGTTLGGGLETALGCHYRIAAQNAKCGFPEVNLGIIPGAGGTVRLPRLIGYEAAVDMATSGASITANEAVENGLVDKISEGDLREDAIKFANEGLLEKSPVPSGLRQNPQLPPNQFWDDKRKKLERRRSEAPLVALDIMKSSHELNFSEAMKIERQSFIALRDSDQSRALRHVFFAERGALRPIKHETKNPNQINHVGVVGGGLMGTGIAVSVIQSGFKCTLIEQNDEAAQRAQSKIIALLEKNHIKNNTPPSVHAQALERLTVSSDMQDLSKSNLVIEAIYEDFNAKKELINLLDGLMDAEIIIATNTSYLNVEELAVDLKHKHRFLGLHFFSPAHIMKIVEVVKLSKTDMDAFALAFNFCLKLNKIPIQAGVIEGFIGNFLLKTYRHQAEQFLLEGYLPSQIDAAMKDFGMPKGPFELQDMTGLDIAWSMRKKSREKGQNIEASISDALCEAGRYGRKTGAGWYDYADDNAAGTNAKFVENLIIQNSQKPLKTNAPEMKEVAEKIFDKMFLQAQTILQDGIAQKEEDIDLAMIHGFGFPRWRGGLMYYCKNKS